MKESNRAITIRQVKLPPAVKKQIYLETPTEFIKERKGKGQKTFRYVEGGYVVARLNQIFSPVGWDFDVIEHIIEPNEVVVKGKLIIKNPLQKYQVSKTQYGSKTRYPEIPLGDTLKAASTDALKKCASFFGIALDVYWQGLDEEKLSEPTPRKGKGKSFVEEKQKITTKELLEITKNKIITEEDPVILNQLKDKINNASEKVYSEENKKYLSKMITEKIKRIMLA